MSESVLADFASGKYTIINSLHRNPAALLNGNADEPIRGVFPVAEGTFRENEKVSQSTASENVLLNSLCSGTSSIVVPADTVSKT